jgi:hypothetical protein
MYILFTVLYVQYTVEYKASVSLGCEQQIAPLVCNCQSIGMREVHMPYASSCDGVCGYWGDFTNRRLRKRVDTKTPAICSAYGAARPRYVAHIAM